MKDDLRKSIQRRGKREKIFGDDARACECALHSPAVDTASLEVGTLLLSSPTPNDSAF
jgi:hypothetical protein